MQERKLRRTDMTEVMNILTNNQNTLQARDDQRRKDAKVGKTATTLNDLYAAGRTYYLLKEITHC